MLGGEIGAVVVLAGFFMAAGWWLLGRRTPPATPPAAEHARAEVKATNPSPAAAVAEPSEPAEKPAALVVPQPPVKEPSKPVERPVEKPIEKPAAPAIPPEPPPTTMKPPPPPAAPAATNLTFARDIFPILKAKCYSCHGENKKKLKGGLDVSTVRLLEKGGDGGPAINRKEPETSPLWDTVASGSMPPGKGTKLSESEKKKLHDWIVGGGK
jgi:outer membrane biosynthesis protein TonB